MSDSEPKPPVRMTGEEWSAILARAAEIQRTAEESADAQADVDAMMAAAEDVGLTRTAVEQALKERLAGMPAATPIAVGGRIFARSTDGRMYVAEALEVGQAGVRVRFLKGDELLVPADHVRPASFVPGQKVSVHWPWWGPWSCTVISYDATKQKVKLSDGWGDVKTFKVSDVWLPQERAAGHQARTKVYLTLLGVGAGIGAVVGSLVTGLLAR